MTDVSQDGFKQLLQAEEKAKEIVAQARKERAALLKKAEDEAAAEIEAYKKERQKQFDDKVAHNTGSLDARAKELLKDANLDKEKIRANAEKNKAAVVELLVKTALKVDLDHKK